MPIYDNDIRVVQDVRSVSEGMLGGVAAQGPKGAISNGGQGEDGERMISEGLTNQRPRLTRRSRWSSSTLSISSDDGGGRGGRVHC